MNRIEILNILIQLLINQIGVCNMRVIPIRNRIHSENVPYKLDKNQSKNINQTCTLTVILNLLNFQPKTSYVRGPFRPKSHIFWSLSLFANLVCPYVRKITHYSAHPNNLVNIQLKNPDIRIKRIIQLKS